MYAIVKCGGKQVKVAAGDVLKVERLSAKAGDSVDLGPVLLVADGSSVTVGSPVVDKAKVAATVLEEIRDDKVLVFKKKRRHNYRRKKGHRQYLSVVQVTEISAGGKSAKAEKLLQPKASTEAAPAKKSAKVAAAKPAAAKKTAAKAAPAKKPAAKAAKK